MSVLSGAELDPATRETLDRFGFDEDRFEQLRARVADGSLSTATNIVRGRVEPPAPEDLTSLPERGEDSHQSRSPGVSVS